MNSARKNAYLSLIIVAVIWGAATPVIKYTLSGIETIPFLTYRFGLSSLIALFSFWHLKTHLPKNRALIIKLLGFSFLTSTVSLGFLFFGLTNTTALDASLITLANPLLVTIAGAIFLRERITKREKIGMFIALLGTLLTVIEPIIQNHDSEIRLSGNILILGYLISSAWGAVLVKELLRSGITPLTLTNMSFVVGFISLLPVFIFRYGLSVSVITDTPLPYHMGVLFMAFLSGNLAYFLSNKAHKTIEISEASLFSYLYPLFSTPLAVLWLGEKITPIFVLGGLIIVAGVILAELKKRRYN
jgi:drug/metabolite transporter (DMT)-like permease